MRSNRGYHIHQLMDRVGASHSYLAYLASYLAYLTSYLASYLEVLDWKPFRPRLDEKGGGSASLREALVSARICAHFCVSFSGSGHIWSSGDLNISL